MPIDPQTLASAEKLGLTVELDDPGGRSNWLAARRVDANGQTLTGLLAAASSVRRGLQAQGLAARRAALFAAPPAAPGPSGSVNWTPLGPSVVARGQASGRPATSGRITALAVGPGGLRAYAGAANGGAWFTGNAGQTWSPLDDFGTSPNFRSGLAADSLAVGALAVAFGSSAANDIVFVGTGEPGAGDGYAGIGIKSSANGGAAFALEATNLRGAKIYRIAIDPDDPSRVFAATTQGLFARPSAPPFTAWTQLTSPAFTNAGANATDFVVAGFGGTQVYYTVFAFDRVYRSDDLGATWSAVSGADPGQRAVLAAGESDPNVVYALSSSGALFRLDLHTGGAFQPVAGVPKALFYNGQGGYDLVLGVDPWDENVVYLAGDLTWDTSDWSLSFYKGTIGGAPGSYTFPFDPANDVAGRDSSNVPKDPTWIGSGIHADSHAFAFATNDDGSHDPSIVWIGSDGGAFASTASGARGTFAPVNDGLAISEITYFGQRADTDAVLLAGAQDAGSLLFRGEQVSPEAPEGDGGGVAVDPNDSYNMMRQYYGVNLSTASDGGASGNWTDLVPQGIFPPVGPAPNEAQQSAVAFESEVGGATPQCAFYSQFGVSPPGVTPTLVSTGTNRLWLTADWGKTWVTLPSATNPYAAGAADTAQDVLDRTPVVASTIASSALIFAATAGGVWRFALAAGTWNLTRIDAGLPAGRVVTSLAVESAARGTLYASLGGGGVEHIWYYDGQWHATGLLETVDIPANAVVVDPDHPEHVYAGTDVGVWKGTRNGTSWTWSLFSSGLPESAIISLAIHQRARLLRAGTHGRGMWEITLDSAGNPDPDIYLRANCADTGRIAGGGRFAWIDGAPDPTAKGNNVYHWMSADIKVRRPNPNNPPLSPQRDYFDFAVNVGDCIDATTHLETADLPGTTDTYFVEVHNRGATSLPGSNVQVLLLLTDAGAALPALPKGYASHIAAADANPAWLGPNWHFASPATPYRTLPGTLSTRLPQVAAFSVDLTSLALPAGHTHVAALAFVTTPLDPLTATETNVDVLVMRDKHVALRSLHLVAATATPAPGAPPHAPQTFFVSFNNAGDKNDSFDIAFERADKLGQLAVALPQHPGAIDPRGFTVPIAARSKVTAAVTVRPPPNAKPGDTFRFDVVQRRAGKIVGGSSYVLAVTKPK